MSLNPIGIYVWNAANNEWIPWNPGSISAIKSGSFLGQPTPTAFYVFNSLSNQWVPWDGTLNGGLPTAITQLTGDVLAGPGTGSVNATVSGVNGATIPVSAAGVGTNGLGQLIAITTLPPSGPAGGDLSGTYPNPTVHQINSGAVPISATFVGTNGTGQLIDNSTKQSVFSYRAITSVTSITSSDFQIEVTSGTFDQPLPTAIGITGKIYSIKNSGTGTVTITTTSSQTIDGNLTQTLAQWDNLQVMSNGSNWIII